MQLLHQFQTIPAAAARSETDCSLEKTFIEVFYCINLTQIRKHTAVIVQESTQVDKSNKEIALTV
jgi:hypothetical protein